MATKQNHRRQARRHSKALHKALVGIGDFDRTLGANGNGTQNAPDPADHPFYRNRFVARGADYENAVRCVGCDLPGIGAPHSCGGAS